LKTLKELRAERADIHEKMSAILPADGDERDLTEEETQQWDDYSARYDDVVAEIEKLETMEARKAKIAAEKAELEKSATPDKRTPVATVHNNELDEEFRNIGDYVGAVYKHVNGDVDVRVQQMKNATSGGYLVPDKFMSEILAVDPEDAVVKSRARMLTSSVPPDAEVRIPALDQGTNDYGAIVVYHQGESDTLTESNAEFRQVTLKPHKLTCYVTASNEIMNNASNFSGFLQGLMQGAVTDATETDYISGNGVNRALGFLNSPCRIDYARTTASQIAFADVVGMLARRLNRGGGNWAWLAAQSVVPQLATIADAGSNNIYLVSAGQSMPNMLMGLPVIYNDRMPSLGNRGDLCLVDLSKYIIADGSGPSLMISEHARFANDEVAIRLVLRTDGQAWLNTAITPKGGGDTQSPFIILQ
jgi:HK97 family phage major capsid protein